MHIGKRGRFIRTHPLLWIFAVVLLVQPTYAQNFSSQHNLNFEQGSNTYWTFGGWQGGAAITSRVSSAWSSEGQFGVQFSKSNIGIVHGSGFYVNATHQKNVSIGDRICIDLRKHSNTGGAWRVRLGTGGTFLNSPIINGIYNDSCAISLGNGQLSIVVEGAPGATTCAAANCLGNFTFDNVTINAHLCDNGILDGYENSKDCGGFCGECSGELPEEDLLAKYAPVLYFHPDERFFPTSIEAMLNESDLKKKGEFFDDTEDEAPVNVFSLDNKDASYFLDMKRAIAGAIANAPDAERFDQYQRTIYGRNLTIGDNIVLQYWFFYPYNDFRGGHEGDWEMVQVILDKTTKEPISATYSYHYDAITYDWNNITKIDETHPQVFVAEGGHASYKEPKSVWRLGFLETLSNYEESVVFTKNDYNLYYWENKDTWTFFNGKWGEFLGNRSIFNGPNSPANLVYGNQPNRWNNPIEFANFARPSEISASTGSPVNLHAYDKQGRHTGLTETGEIETEIPGTYLYVPSDDGKEVIVILSDEDIEFVIKATDNGAFNLSIENYDRNFDAEVTSYYQDVQITEDTIVTMNFASTNPNLILRIDEEGDGITDSTRVPETIEGDYTATEIDSDNDGYADSIDTCATLYNPSQITDFDGDGFNHVECGGNDCNDNDAKINPNALDLCDDVDNNCDSNVDNSCSRNSKQYALTLLQPFSNEPKIDKVIGSVISSLDRVYYIDDETLKSENGQNDGGHVFDHEAKAVSDCFEEDIAIHSVCFDILPYLLIADKVFLEKAINEAVSIIMVNEKNKPCYVKELEKAEKRLLSAEDKDNSVATIKHYKEAWEAAQKAITIAKEEKKKCS